MRFIGNSFTMGTRTFYVWRTFCNGTLGIRWDNGNEEIVYRSALETNVRNGTIEYMEE